MGVRVGSAAGRTNYNGDPAKDVYFLCVFASIIISDINQAGRRKGPLVYVFKPQTGLIRRTERTI
jgi:hypothetical protein